MAAKTISFDRATTRALTALVFGGLMVVLDVTITNVAVGRLSQVFDASLAGVQWVATGYTLALAAVIPTCAWLIDRLGPRRVYLLALALFLLGSTAAGVAWSLGSLIAARVVQGLGGGLVMPTAMTIALRSAPAERRGAVMGVLGLPVLVGPAVGPTLGGWLLDTLSWRWIFFVNIPVGMVAIVASLRWLPRVVGERARGLDTRGLLLLPPGLVVLVLGIADAGRSGAVTIRAGMEIASGFVVVAVFVRHVLRERAPLIDLRLLSRRDMALGGVVVALFAAAYFGSMFLVPLYFQVVRGASASASGALLIPQALATGTSMQVASRVVDRVPARRVIIVGITLAVAGVAGFALSLAPDVPLWRPVTAMVLVGLGAGATLMPTMTTATRRLSAVDVPSGATVLNIVNQVAVSVGTAVATVVLTLTLRGRLGPIVRNGVGDLYGLGAAGRARLGPDLADGFAISFVFTLVLLALALLLATRYRTADPRGGDSEGARAAIDEEVGVR